MTTDFANRVALITGGSRGIGRATALRLAREGADIAFSYASRSADAEETAAAIRALGRRAVFAACNVGNPDDVRRLVDQARQLGPIDYLFHSGAISNIQDHSTLSFELWRETIEVNLTGTYLAVFAVKDEMIQRRFGRIVTLSSVAALRPRKMQIHYASAKAGVIAFTRCCAEAFAPYNVRINCVAPGLTDTEMARAAAGSDVLGSEGDAARPAGQARGNRQRDPISPERRIELHDRPHPRSQRRPHHAALSETHVIVDGAWHELASEIKQVNGLETDARRLACGRWYLVCRLGANGEESGSRVRGRPRQTRARTVRRRCVCRLGRRRRAG